MTDKEAQNLKSKIITSVRLLGSGHEYKKKKKKQERIDIFLFLF